MNFTIKNNSGETALDLAKKYNCSDIIDLIESRMLLDSINLEVKTEGDELDEGIISSIIHLIEKIINDLLRLLSFKIEDKYNSDLLENKKIDCNKSLDDDGQLNALFDLNTSFDDDAQLNTSFDDYAQLHASFYDESIRYF